MIPARSLTSAVLCCALVACGADTNVYPSLGPRAAEKHGFEEPDAPPLVAVATDPVLDAKLGTAGDDLDRIAKQFAEAATAAEHSATAARGAAAGSEPWLAAQTALAGLDDLHAQVSALGTDTETLAVERAAALAPDYPALTALTTRIEAEDTREGELIARLARSLAPA